MFELWNFLQFELKEFNHIICIPNISSLTILFHHSLLSSVQIDHIICDYQYFRPKTHIIYHSNNGILVVWQSVDMTWTWNPRYAQDKPLSSSIWKVTPKAKHWEGQVQIFWKGFLAQEEKAQVVIIWYMCVLFALNKAMKLVP